MTPAREGRGKAGAPVFGHHSTTHLEDVMQHPTIAVVIAHARQQDSELGLARPDRMARRELDRVDGSGDLR
jgi:hypothetical protein